MFLKILHASIVTLALGCDLFGAQCLAEDRNNVYPDFNEKAFTDMVKSGRCSDAFDLIWHGVAIGDLSMTEILEKDIEDKEFIFLNAKDYGLNSKRISLTLQMKIFGRGRNGSDTRLIRRLSSAEVTQPNGKKIGVCLAASKGSGEAVQQCIESAKALGIIDDFMKLYFYADKAMNHAAVVQCGRN
ncbi:hypothetical protein NKI51_28935 [Mesorhizobium australicum]|uniref:hypothetical protein n=1 Tax=Mesorhizobium australicum TaxID=536018 RepID=UPI0033380A11